MFEFFDNIGDWLSDLGQWTAFIGEIFELLPDIFFYIVSGVIIGTVIIGVFVFIVKLIS